MRASSSSLPVRLRWTPDGTRLSFLALADGRPQVFSTSAQGGPSNQITSAPQGVAAYEWASDGKYLAFTARDATQPSPAIRVHDPPPATRLFVKVADEDAREVASAALIDGFSWAPDGGALVYAAAPVSGFSAPYYTRLYRVSARVGSPETLVDRPGMNTTPQFAPDGTRVAFVSTNERFGLLAPRGLAVVDLRERHISTYPMNGALNVVVASGPQSGARDGRR
jgi:Tol biopolymer transport system component